MIAFLLGLLVGFFLGIAAACWAAIYAMRKGIGL